jgi:hypothetical protein
VAFFAWAATKGKILTTDNLREKDNILWIGIACVKKMGIH